MNILILDSSSANLSVVIVKDQTVHASFIKCDLNHSKLVVDVVSSVCRDSGVTLSDIDVFGVCVGPGSFTGIRIGIATIKGYNFAFRKKIVSVNSLEVLSYTVKNSQVSCFIPDGKTGFYFAAFNSNTPASEPILIDKHRYTEIIKKETSVTYDDSMNLCDALVHAVKEKIKNEDFTSNPHAMYIRKCQAEMEKDVKNASNN